MACRLLGLLQIHGGGAHGRAGYGHLAARLAHRHSIWTLLIDLRGHGRSAGPRGDAPSPERVWTDLHEFVRLAGTLGRAPIFLGGHSSGAGLILNYGTSRPASDVRGYVFLAPEFGFRSGTARAGRREFAQARVAVFMLSALSGGHLFGHTAAVRLNFPRGVLRKDPLLVGTLTRNMAVALTPEKPQLQFQALRRPFVLLAAAEDELLAPHAVVGYGAPGPGFPPPSSTVRIVPGKHLSVLLSAGDPIGAGIAQILAGRKQ